MNAQPVTFVTTPEPAGPAAFANGQTVAPGCSGRPPDPKAQPHTSRVGLGGLVDEAGAEVKAGGGEGQPVGWNNEVPPGVEIEADREQLFRVLSNLGHNAVEAGAGEVRVSTWREGEWIYLDVADDGPGLTPKARDKLFQPFAGTARDGGTGRGLGIVRDIMRAHGGDVSLLDGEGAGATFRLKLPADRGDRS